MDRHEAYTRARALADEGRTPSQIAKDFVSHGVQVTGEAPRTWRAEDVEALLASPPDAPPPANWRTTADPRELMASDLREIRRSAATTAFWARLVGIVVLLWIALSIMGAIWFAIELAEEWDDGSYSSAALVARP